MNTFKHFGSWSFAAMIILLSAAPVTAQSPDSVRQTASEINAANTLLRDGKVDEALEAYRRIVPVEQQRDELNYNMAVAEYRKGNIEAAEKIFANVSGTDSPTIAADGRYNLGNCQYAGALKLAEQDKPAAIKLLRKAIANYRAALRGKPDNADARANIELAVELIRTLEQEQKQKEEAQKEQDNQQQQDADKQQDQQNKDQQKQDKSQDPESQKDESQKDSDQPKSDSQDSESDQEKSGQQQQQQNQDEQSAADQPQEDQQRNDKQRADQSGDEQQKNDQQNRSGQQSQPKSSQSSQKPQQPSGEQQQPEDDGTAEEQAAKHDPVPIGDLKAASEQEQDKKSEGAAGTADQNSKDGLMTREEALKMLQSVRDRDMLRRMQQQREERSRRVRVDKDW